MPGIKSKHDFKILLVYPNLSMLLAPPLAYGIFTALLRRGGYQVDIFDVTPYVGEGASAMAENTSVGETVRITGSARMKLLVRKEANRRRL